MNVPLPPANHFFLPTKSRIKVSHLVRSTHETDKKLLPGVRKVQLLANILNASITSDIPIERRHIFQKYETFYMFIS